jgi:apolipoprotein N-acyltransferase
MAPLLGTSGITVLVVATTAMLVIVVEGHRRRWLLWSAIGLLLLTLGGWAWNAPTPDPIASLDVAIVQGSTPCPFEHCPPNERLGTFQQHLELTRRIAPGSADLVIWSEGSTGSSNADPVLNPEIGAAIAGEARRIGAWFLVGSDRPLNETHWENANVVFDPEGELVGEYRKQHPVPFGEYIPWRPVFDWIPDLAQVPRDMIPGEGPVVFDIGDGVMMGSVISFEGGFARYPRQHAREGANLMVVATNEGSYGTTPGSDQFIGMTRMRAAELGTPVAHAAVTGRSVFVDESGALSSAKTGLGTIEIVTAVLHPNARSIYAVTGDLVMLLAAVVGLATWWRSRQPLVASGVAKDEEE